MPARRVIITEKELLVGLRLQLGHLCRVGLHPGRAAVSLDPLRDLPVLVRVIDARPGDDHIDRQLELGKIHHR